MLESALIKQLNALSMRRAKDRETMAKIIEAQLPKWGARCERVEDRDNRTILLEIEGARGLRVTVELDGSMFEPDVHMLSWNIAADSDARLNNATFGGDVNPYHNRKATYMAEGASQLLIQLERGLRMAASGRAFLDYERPVAQQPEASPMRAAERMRA